MRVDVREAEGAIIVDLRGRLVAGTGDELLRDVMNELIAEGWTKILINLSEVTKIDSSGIGELVASTKLAQRFESAVKLVNIQPQVLAILELSQLVPHLAIHDTEEQALASFGEDEEPAAFEEG